MTTTKNLTEQQERDTAREQGLDRLMDALDRSGQKYDVEVVDGTAVVTGTDAFGVMSVQAQPMCGRYDVRYHGAREWASEPFPLAQEPEHMTLSEAAAVIGWES